MSEFALKRRALQIENQHWLPKFILKNFADSDGRVFRLNIADNVITKPPPKNAASSPNFYELMLEGEPVSFEQKFQKIETVAALALSSVVNANSLAHLSLKQRKAISDFIAVQSFRTEAYRLGLEAQNDKIDQSVSLSKLWSSLPQLSHMISERHWAFLVTSIDDPFYLGDSPVVLQSTDEPEKGMQLGFDILGVEAYMPLSPTHALYMPCPRTCHTIIDGYMQALSIHVFSIFARSDKQVMQNSQNSLKTLASRTLQTAGPLYRALTQGIPIIANHENVENLNYLQCAWASSGVYSNRSDFDFAKQVFNQTPQYKNVIPVSLVEVL